jgi:probable HAF family extracellular repeat protein
MTNKYQCLYTRLARGHAAICLALGLQVPALGQSYFITDPGEPGDYYRLAHGINSAGDVVGEYEFTNVLSIGAFWYHQGAITDLGVLPGYFDAFAYGINDSGQIVGWCDVAATGVERAFLYRNGTMQDLGTLSSSGPMPSGYSEAYAINRAGQVVGTATLANTAVNHAFLYSGGKNKDLGALGGTNYNSSAFGLNNVGVIVGESEVTNSINSHAFSYSNNIMTDLGTLPGGSYSRANAVNDSGVIVGESDTLVGAGLPIHAFVCANGPGSMQDLGTLGGSESSANAINSAGRVVGYAVDSNNVSRAFIFDGSKMLDLNDLIPAGSGWANLEAAVGINDNGQIAGYGTYPDGSYHAFLLTPSVPLTVTITNPTPNATFTALATFVVGASVFDGAGTVTNVEFLVNGGAISNATSSPYSITVSNLAAGNYALSAVASDNGGLKATNSIGITVTKAALAPVTISNTSFSGNTFSFSFETQTGYTYAGQYTTPLSLSNAWLTFTNLAGNGSTVRVTNSTLPDAQRFYRVVAQ